MDDLVWQVERFSLYDFDAVLSHVFAAEMYRSNIGHETQRALNSQGASLLQRMNIFQNEPFQFYGDSALVERFVLGNGGRWLSANHSGIERLAVGDVDGIGLKYSSHNIDHPLPAYALMALAGQWVGFREQLRR